MPSTPPKPKTFAPDLAPVGVEVKFITFLDDRPPMTPDLLHWHTNGASGEGTVDSAWNHTHAKPNSNTLPHYQLDRTHNGITRCRKMCPTDRKGIGSMTVSRTSRDRSGDLIWPDLTLEQQMTIDAHPGRGCAFRTIVIETADTGYDPAKGGDPSISAFDAGQLELAATITAYESIVWGIPLVFSPRYWEPGIASHTDPDGFPYTTNAKGKICPGSKKKAQVRELIIPRARVIAAAWLAPTPPPPPFDPSEEDPMFIERDSTTKAVHIGDGVIQTVYPQSSGKDDPAVNWVVTRAIRAGRLLLSDDGNGTCREVRSLGDIFSVSPAGTRSLGRGGTA